MSASDAFGGADESTLRIVARVVRAAPRGPKLLAALALLYAAAMVAWAYVTVGGAVLRSQPLWAGVAGGTGAILLSWGYALTQVAQGTWSFRRQWRLAPSRLNQMLLVLPTIALIAAMLAVGGLVAAVPYMRVQPWTLLAVPGHLLITFYAAKAIGDSTRFLYRHAQEQARWAERAQAEATRAQLEALQAQLNPHFLFNALNAIASLVRTDARAAERTVEDLAHVLRRTLDRAKRARVRLDEEVEFVRAYLAVENARFGPRLHVDWAIEDAALACAVPPLTLQPLVENALKHAFAQRIDGGRVRIAAARADGMLRLTVQDDGAGFANGWREGGGLGNLRRRLDNLYGDAASLEVSNEGAGAVVTITLPTELASDARPDRR